MCGIITKPLQSIGLLPETPKPPDVAGIPEPPSAPRMQDPAVMLMRNRERTRLQGESGRRSTILTSGQGAVMDKIQNKTLLGS